MYLGPAPEPAGVAKPPRPGLGAKADSQPELINPGLSGGRRMRTAAAVPRPGGFCFKLSRYRASEII